MGEMLQPGFEIKDAAPPAKGPRQSLSLFDSVCIVVGIIVGAGIFETAPAIARGASSWTMLLLLWAIGGVLSLAGALCYAELATTYPEEGGDYVYLNRAFGPWAGFLFAWSQVLIVRPGSIASMAFPFAHYTHAVMSPSACPAGGFTQPLLAAGTVIVLSLSQAFNFRFGPWMQNLLTVSKVLALAAIIVIAPFVASVPPVDTAAALDSFAYLPLALILILFTYGGWSEIALVAAEVKNPSRNLLRTLVLGTCAVTVLYLLVNLAFLQILGLPGLQASNAVAVDAVSSVLPYSTGSVVSLLICISVLGAINGLIFTGARVSYALGREHSPFAPLARWHSHLETPFAALLLQAFLSAAIILVAGTFTRALIYTTAVVWLFFLATGVALFVLRIKDRARHRPYRVLGYPITPLVFCFSCVFLTYSALEYDWSGSAIALALVLAGLPVYWLSHRRSALGVSD